MVKWKGYLDSENQWVNKDDVFTNKALQQFKSLNLTSEVHIRQLWIPNDYDSTLFHMSSNTSPISVSFTINNVLSTTDNAEHCPISRAFGALIEPECGWVSPSFMEYQDTGATDTQGDQEGAQVEEDGVCYNWVQACPECLLTGYGYGTRCVMLY